MEGFKGTKGEWYISGKIYPCIESKNIDQLITVKYPIISAVSSYGMRTEEYQANAKIIASAPNMLNSLQETAKSISLVKQCLSKLTDDTRELEDILDNWKERNQRVINKALGKTK